MPIVKVMERRQVVIPKELFEQLGLEIGDYLEAKVKGGTIVYVPKKLVDRDPWYWSPEGQARIQEAFEDIKEGRVAGPFETVEDLIKDLRTAQA